MAANDKLKARARRKASIRSRISGSAERPRLCVFRSSKHIYAQVVDDTSAQSICAVSTLTAGVKGALGSEDSKVDGAVAVGSAIAKACLEKGISRVVFDRNGYIYHGRIKALASAAREAGLEF